MQKIIFSLAVVFAGLASGYIITLLFPPFSYGTKYNNITRKYLQRAALLCLNPVAFMGAIWIIDLKNFQLIAMPFIGVLAISAGGAAAVILAKIIKLNKEDTGSYFCCGSFTNTGSIGALVCFSFLGEKGFALVPLYKIFEVVLIYSAGFSIAKSFKTRPESGISSINKNIFKDSFVIASMSSIVIGLILNTSGYQRPQLLGELNQIIIPLGSFVILCSIGMALQFRKMKIYLLKALALLPLKYLLVPALTFTAASLAGLGSIDNGLPLKVVLILSSMPVAFIALIPPAIYGLNLDLANTCWLVSTLFMIITVPVLMLLVSL